MYRYLRNSHLFLGLFSCLFLLMYGVSSVQMSHSSWFNLRPTVTTTELTLAPNASDARAVARELMDGHGLRGEIAGPRHRGGLAFAITRQAPYIRWNTQPLPALPRFAIIASASSECRTACTINGASTTG
jgi:hypothetical protein